MKNATLGAMNKTREAKVSQNFCVATRISAEKTLAFFGERAV
jgi:hypothetical protein